MYSSRRAVGPTFLPKLVSGNPLGGREDIPTMAVALVLLVVAVAVAVEALVVVDASSAPAPSLASLAVGAAVEGGGSRVESLGKPKKNSALTYMLICI